MMQVSKRIPFEDPNVLNIVRALYIASNLIIAALYLYTQFKVNKKKGKRLVRFHRHHKPDVSVNATGSVANIS